MNETSENTPTTSHKIMLIDDDVFIRRILALGLRNAGLEVHVSENGEEALEQLEAGGFDAVIVDLMMPVMDGRHFIRCARDRFGSELPILVLTSVDRADATKDVLEGGACAILYKPAKIPQILEKLREIGV